MLRRRRLCHIFSISERHASQEFFEEVADFYGLRPSTQLGQSMFPWVIMEWTLLTNKINQVFQLNYTFIHNTKNENCTVRFNFRYWFQVIENAWYMRFEIFFCNSIVIKLVKAENSWNFRMNEMSMVHVCSKTEMLNEDAGNQHKPRQCHHHLFTISL